VAVFGSASHSDPLPHSLLDLCFCHYPLSHSIITTNTTPQIFLFSFIVMLGGLHYGIYKGSYGASNIILEFPSPPLSSQKALLKTIPHNHPSVPSHGKTPKK
jgi:hypothetical protein